MKRIIALLLLLMAIVFTSVAEEYDVFGKGAVGFGNAFNDDPFKKKTWPRSTVKNLKNYQKGSIVTVSGIVNRDKDGVLFVTDSTGTVEVALFGLIGPRLKKAYNSHQVGDTLTISGKIGKNKSSSSVWLLYHW